MKSLKDGRYEMNMSKRLGSGNFADVYLARDTQTGQDVAIKVIAMDKIRQYGDKLQRAIEKEIYVLKNLTKFENPYLLRFIDCFDTANNKYLVMEFCNGGTLGDVLKKRRILPEGETLEKGYQIVLGLSALEEAGISHRDIKPDNVFIHDNICKIGDFGFASHESKFTSSLGTCIYMGPEFYVGKGAMNSKVDVWAFGVTIHQLIFNGFPFDGHSQQEVIQMVINNEYNPPSTPKISPETADMLRRCLDKNPDTRISFKELRTHPAFKAYMPVTQNRLGADVKQSLFNVQYTGHIQPNVYQELKKECVENGYIKAEEEEKNKKKEEEARAAKNTFITKTLVEYKNAYMYYVEISQNLENVQETELCSFFILKRGLQRAASLLYYIKDENQPPEIMLHDTTPQDWQVYLKTEFFENFLPYCLYDVIDLRSLFEKKFELLRKLYLPHDPRYATWINDDLEMNLRDSFQIFVKETIKRLFQSGNPDTLDIALKMVILNEIDTKDSKCTYLDNIREKVEKLLKADVPTKQRIVSNYLSR